MTQRSSALLNEMRRAMFPTAGVHGAVGGVFVSASEPNVLHGIECSFQFPASD